MTFEEWIQTKLDDKSFNYFRRAFQECWDAAQQSEPEQKSSIESTVVLERDRLRMIHCVKQLIAQVTAETKEDEATAEMVNLIEYCKSELRKVER